MSVAFFTMVAILSLAVIILAAKYMIIAISSYSKKTGLSDFIVGFLIVSIGTSVPELSTGIMSAIAGRNELSFGNVIGANLLDVTIVLGLSIVLLKHYRNTSTLMTKSMYAMYLIVGLPLLLGFDGVISRMDGFILLMFFLFYVLSLLRKEHEFGRVKESVLFKHIAVDMVTFLLALIAILLGARFLVFSSIQLSNELNIPLFLIGLIFISLTTTTPELTIGIKSALSKHSNLSFGNVFGAIAMNTTLVVGISSIIHPIPVSLMSMLLPMGFLIGSVVYASLLFRKPSITYKDGIFLIMIYLAFICLQVIFS